MIFISSLFQSSFVTVPKNDSLGSLKCPEFQKTTLPWASWKLWLPAKRILPTLNSKLFGWRGRICPLIQIWLVPFRRSRRRTLTPEYRFYQNSAKQKRHASLFGSVSALSRSHKLVVSSLVPALRYIRTTRFRLRRFEHTTTKFEFPCYLVQP